MVNRSFHLKKIKILFLIMLFFSQVRHLNAMSFSTQQHIFGGAESHRGGWDEARFDKLLVDQKFKDIQNLVEGFLGETGLAGSGRRSLISWIRETGCNGGSVPLLFMWLNLKTKNGAERNFSTVEFEDVLTYVLISLIRTLQDVVCVKKILGCGTADTLYDTIKLEYYNWLMQNSPMTDWPSFREITRRASCWFEMRKDQLALPAWAGYCNERRYGRFTVEFSSPSPSSLRALEESRRVRAWREYSFNCILKEFSGLSSWNAFFNTKGTSLLQVVDESEKEDRKLAAS